MFSSAVLTLLFPAALVAQEFRPHISSKFTDTSYRIERNFAPVTETRRLLHQIVHEGVEEDANKFDQDTLAVYGDSGMKHVERLQKDQFASTMQSFISNEYHVKHQQLPSKINRSLVYYIEKLNRSTEQKNEKFIEQVVDNNILENGGTVHLYISAPETAALANHTDTTDIVVLQLDGDKEWLLCKAKADLEEEEGFFGLRNEEADFNKKLGACSTYEEAEFEKLDCERHMLHPGDALFLPRRIVHSARATANSFSAHLTFAYKDRNCRDHPVLAAHRHLAIARSCDDSCDFDCDENCNGSCDTCLTSCDESCWTGLCGCDHTCINSCDNSCDGGCDGCDSSCDE